MRYEDIKRLRPDEASLRAMDKIGYRYPRGESYFDILSRLDPLVHEMESYHEPLLIVSHQATLRVLATTQYTTKGAYARTTAKYTTSGTRSADACDLLVVLREMCHFTGTNPVCTCSCANGA